MKYNEIFKKIGCNNSDEVFEYLLSNLKSSNILWDYFVNWEKVFSNVASIEIDLNTLNYIIGGDSETKLKILLQKQPHLVKTFPFLLAIREDKLDILDEFNLQEFKYISIDLSNKKNISDTDISNYIIFLKKSGFMDLLKQEKIKNLVDFVIGVETGLDTNGRKNRSGHCMEMIVEMFISDICVKNNFMYLKEVNNKKLKEEWNIILPTEDSKKRLDFVIDNGKEIFLIETNFYNGGGSKLKSTAKEYEKMYKFWNDNGFKFIWITDGKGWQSSAKPLKDAFNVLDYILNLEMLINGILDDIILNDL